jgi:hypothetical protein
MLGAGQLVSTIWQTGRAPGRRSARFNIYRLSPHDGRVSQLLRGTDLHDLVKLCQVLAVTLADDDGLPPEQRRTLGDLAARLSHITTTRS